ncbi:hypothetical protein F4820DRAFT_448322 [Hypoxylon rubiginosum]|uniref:Uncharacterized protein n=1 Tax=Hypoxylon rubiginosum TaxID=110542 RepID=A0ACB9Z1Z7_9PEZI|nr:hypothetical protein F4820DRAFT_448322 [Hypoxylon rubiginosum]
MAGEDAVYNGKPKSQTYMIWVFIDMVLGWAAIERGEDKSGSSPEVRMGAKGVQI